MDTPNERTSRLETALPIIAALLVFICICEPLCRGLYYAGFDHLESFYPYRVIYEAAVGQGELGLWGPHYFRGFSLVGIGQPGIFHPWRWVCAKFLALDVGIALDLVVIFPLTYLGAFLLFRHYRMNRPVALWGATLHACSIFFLSHFGQTHMITILGHAPWVVLAYECSMLAKSRWWALLLLGLGYASMHLLGHPHTVFLVSCIVGIAILHCGLRNSWRRSWWVATGLAAVAILAGTMIGSLTLIPMLDLLGNHPRGQLSAAEHGNFSAHAIHLLQNLSPAFFTELPGDLVYKDNQPTVFLRNPTANAVYFGAGVLALISAAAVRWRRDWLAPKHRGAALLLGGMLLLFLLLAMGRYGGLHSLLWHVPWLNTFRTPHRYKAVIAAILVVVVTIILQRLWRHTSEPTDKRRDVIAMLLPAVPFVGVFVIGLTLGSVIFRGTRLEVSGIGPLLWGPAVAVAAIALFFARQRKWVPQLLALLLVADVAMFGLHIVRDVEYRDRQELLAFKTALQTRDHTYRLIADSNLPVWEGHYMVGGYEGLFPIEPLDLGNLQHLRLAAIGEFEIDGERRPMTDPLPRVRLVPNLEINAEPLAGLAEADLESTAHCGPGHAEAFTAPALGEMEYVRTEHDGFEVLRMSIQVEHRRVLVVADKWDAGWQCLVDGEHRTILPLYNGAVRGVMVDKGEHEVIMVYAPGTLATATRVAVAGGILLLLLVLVSWRCGLNFSTEWRSV